MNLEFNKIFAALLVAGITAGTAAFISEQVMYSHDLKEDAVPIEGVEVVAGGVSAPAGPEPVMHLLAAAEVARGQKLSKACAACHSFDKGGANKVGPNLWNVMGNNMGAHAGYSYSDAMSTFGESWGYDQMNKFLYKPKQYMPGTKMGYIGIKKQEDRAAMIAWLRTLSDSPIAMPTESEISAEKAELAPEPDVIEEDDNTMDMDAEGATDTDSEAEENVDSDTETSEDIQEKEAASEEAKDTDTPEEEAEDIIENIEKDAE